jgi:hypothetical protein
LADYIAQKYQRERRRQDIEDIDRAGVLSNYLTDIGEPGDQFAIEAGIDRLNDFWGGRKLSGAMPRPVRPTSNIAATMAVRAATSRRNQPSRKRRLSPGCGARVATAQGRGPRLVAHARGSSRADLAPLAPSGEADDPFRDVKR